jgi:hypothetical protein
VLYSPLLYYVTCVLHAYYSCVLHYSPFVPPCPLVVCFSLVLLLSLTVHLQFCLALGLYAHLPVFRHLLTYGVLWILVGTCLEGGFMAEEPPTMFSHCFMSSMRLMPWLSATSAIGKWI